jgi:hypothetical protein
MNTPTKWTLAAGALALFGGLSFAGLAIANPGFGHHGGPFHMMADEMLGSVDTNSDGALSQEEIDAAVTARYAAFDDNKDGKLSLDEFQMLWADLTRPVAVRAFQFLDPNGDGLIERTEVDKRLIATTTPNFPPRTGRMAGPGTMAGRTDAPTVLSNRTHCTPQPAWMLLHAGWAFSQGSDLLYIDDPAALRTQQHAETISMAMAQVGVNATAAFDGPYGRKAMVTQNGTAVAAVDAMTGAEAIAHPIGRRVPEAAIFVAKPVAPVMRPFLLRRIEFPVHLRLLCLCRHAACRRLLVGSASLLVNAVLRHGLLILGRSCETRHAKAYDGCRGNCR